MSSSTDSTPASLPPLIPMDAGQSFDQLTPDRADQTTPPSPTPSGPTVYSPDPIPGLPSYEHDYSEIVAQSRARVAEIQQHSRVLIEQFRDLWARAAVAAEDNEAETAALAPARTRRSEKMAIDQILYPETEGLARQEKGFYPVTIPVSHWQLRHYISSPEPDHLYYASSQHIYCLNTATKKRRHIATLPFEARCTASGYGWVCVGGEHEGHFAAIKLDGHRAMDVDSALPLSSFGQNLSRRAPTVKVERIGEEIVNSISIHRIQDEEAHLDDIVAVLTNNDRTVRIFSLPSGLETKCKDLPFAINHATISPDGTILVAVGDYNQAYFYKREIVDQPPQIPKPHNRLTSANVDWRKLCRVTLHASSPETTLGYFTTAWSPSGALVAVGSEGGYITILDRDVLEDEDLDDENRDEAVVAVVPGSRADHPSPHPGAIRSMMFSPEPWDLFVWAEDQGRICIGDLRTGLKSRQIISLEPKDEDLEKYELESQEDETEEEPEPRHVDDLEAELLRRYRGIPDDQSAVNFATEYIESRRRNRGLAAARMQQAAQASSRQNAASTSMEDDPGGLTASEQQILESLRTSRQREEARSTGQIPRSVNYTTPDMFTGSGGRSSSNTPSGESSTRPISDILSSVQDSFPELSRTNAASPRPGPSMSHTPPTEHLSNQISELQDAMWVSAARMSSVRSRVVDASSRLPRRRQSVVLSPPASTSESSTAQREPWVTGGTQAEDDRAEDENPWRTIEEQYSSTARGPLFEGAGRAQAASPLPPELDSTSRQRDRDTRPSDAFFEDASRRDYETQIQRRMAASAARTRERWRNSRLVGGPGATSTAATDPRSATERIGGITMAEARRLASFPDGYEALIRRTQMRGISGREVGVRTAGLAWSPDGRTLWAACESGIFEIGVRVKGRMFLPSLDPR